jgi:sugar/nucleoside kinase (ribokinase family)
MKALVIGSTNKDSVIELKEKTLEIGVSNKYSGEIANYPGGCGFNVAVTLGLFPWVNVTLATSVGARDYFRSIQSDGYFDTRPAVIYFDGGHRDVLTNIIVLNYGKSKQRTFLAPDSSVENLSAVGKRNLAREVNNSDVVVCTGVADDYIIPLNDISDCLSKATSEPDVVLDCIAESNHHTRYTDFLEKHVSIFIPSSEEVFELCRDHGYLAGADAAWTKNKADYIPETKAPRNSRLYDRVAKSLFDSCKRLRIFGIKMADKGVVLYEKQTLGTLKRTRVNIETGKVVPASDVERTGAGDAWVGAFVGASVGLSEKMMRGEFVAEKRAERKTSDVSDEYFIAAHFANVIARKCVLQTGGAEWRRNITGQPRTFGRDF